MRKSFSLSLPLTVCPKNALKSQAKIFRLLGVTLLPEKLRLFKLGREKILWK